MDQKKPEEVFISELDIQYTVKLIMDTLKFRKIHPAAGLSACKRIVDQAAKMGMSVQRVAKRPELKN